METKSLKNNSSKKTIDSKWRKVMIAGVPAIALGGVAGVFASKNVDTEEVIEDLNVDATDVATQSTPEPIGDIEVASSVNNDMTFEEAFAAAREEVGVGGVFEWNGTVYGTYYENEWDSMTAQEQEQFSHEAIGIPYEPKETEEPIVAEVEEPVVAEAVDAEVVAEVEEPMVAEAVDAEVVAEVEEPMVAEVEPEMIIVDQIQWEENGNIYTATETRIDDEQYILVDENGGVIEAMVADLDGDGQIDEGEALDIRDMQIQQEDINDLYALQNGSDVGMPDSTDNYMADNSDMIDAGF